MTDRTKSAAGIVLLTLASGQFLMTLDSSVMNVSIAQVAEDLGTTVTGIQTAITLYTLVMATLMITGGKIGSLIGRKRAFMIGCVIYGAGSLTTSLAPNLTVLIIGWSFLEGIGAALIMPAIVALVASNFAPEGRPRAYGLVASAGLLTLLAFGMTINVYSAIGLMMLFGIVKKNSILQVDYTNTLRAQGLDRHTAIIEANHVRLRPILMTTISIVAGMLPIAFGRGAGSGSRASMAVTIIGGQLLCLLLTLLVTPVVYSYFDGMREAKITDVAARLWARARLKKRSAAAPTAVPVPVEQRGL